jgi:hypothetical protein
VEFDPYNTYNQRENWKQKIIEPLCKKSSGQKEEARLMPVYAEQMNLNHVPVWGKITSMQGSTRSHFYFEDGSRVYELTPWKRKLLSKNHIGSNVLFLNITRP